MAITARRGDGPGEGSGNTGQPNSGKLQDARYRIAGMAGAASDLREFYAAVIERQV